MDWRCNAARAASSSRTSWGTPLIVICTDMNALCHRRQRPASSSPPRPPKFLLGLNNLAYNLRTLVQLSLVVLIWRAATVATQPLAP